MVKSILKPKLLLFECKKVLLCYSLCLSLFSSRFQSDFHIIPAFYAKLPYFDVDIIFVTFYSYISSTFYFIFIPPISIIPQLLQS